MEGDEDENEDREIIRRWSMSLCASAASLKSLVQHCDIVLFWISIDDDAWVAVGGLIPNKLEKWHVWLPETRHVSVKVTGRVAVKGAVVLHKMKLKDFVAFLRWIYGNMCKFYKHRWRFFLKCTTEILKTKKFCFDVCGNQQSVCYSAINWMTAFYRWNIMFVWW